MGVYNFQSENSVNKMLNKFDAAIPRRMYWNNDIPSAASCPECGATLEKESHVYLLLVKEGAEVTPFITGNNDGSFCPKCPVVVLDKDGFAQKAVLGVAESEHFMVAGIVDIDSIPKDKEHIPLGGDNNPIPLVEFLPSPAVNKNRGIRTEKIGRNDPCPCGSRKKYKKCCMGKLIA